MAGRVSSSKLGQVLRLRSWSGAGVDSLRLGVKGMAMMGGEGRARSKARRGRRLIDNGMKMVCWMSDR